MSVSCTLECNTILQAVELQKKIDTESRFFSNVSGLPLPSGRYPQATLYNRVEQTADIIIRQTFATRQASVELKLVVLSKWPVHKCVSNIGNNKLISLGRLGFLVIYIY